MFNYFLVVVPVIIPSQPLELSDGFKCFFVLFFIFFAIESIIIFIRRFKK